MVKVVVNKVVDFLKRNWLEDIKNFYLGVNPVYRQSFWILFIITNIVFGFHTINFLWGNHDWDSLIAGKTYASSFWEGRYGAWIVSEILTYNQYLPIISALWAFAALSLSAVLLAIYWRVPQKISYFVIFGLILNITPYTLPWLWYAHWTVNIFFGRLFIVAGFILSDKYSKGTLKQKVWGNLLSILLLNFSLGIYPSFIGTLPIVFIGRVLVDMLDWNTIRQGIREHVKSYTFIIFNILMASVIYKVALEWMKYKGAIREGFYNMQTTPIAEIPLKILTCIKAAWTQFTDFSIPFYPDILTKLFLILAIIFVLQITVFSKKSFIMKVSILVMFAASLFLTKVVAILSSVDSVIFLTRVDFCGYVLFNALIIALCLNIGGILQNIKILIGCLIIYLFTVNDLHQLRTWKMGFESEKMMWNRVVERINKHQLFNYNSKYTYIQIGDWKPERVQFVNKNEKMMRTNDADLLNYSFTPRWAPFTTIAFYSHYNIKKYFRVSDFTNPEYMSVLKHLNNAGLLENAKAWPAENSIIVYEDIILVVTDEKDLQKAKNILQKEKALRDRIKAKTKPVATSELQAEAK